MAQQKKGIDPTILVIASGAALLYFGVLNPLLQWIGIKDDPNEKENKENEEEARKSTEKEILKQQKPTKTAAQLSAIVEVIYNAMKYSSVSDNYETAGYYLCLVQNDADVITLINLFGKRDECYFGLLCYTKTLAQMVSSNLSKEKIAAINDNYRRKGIKYRW